MVSNKVTWRWIVAWLAIGSLPLLFAACGGGAADQAPLVIGGDQPPGMAANFPGEPAAGGGSLLPGVGETPAPGDYPASSAALGVSTEAPLGTAEEYDANLVTPEVMSYTPPRTPSAMVIDGDGFNQVMDLTIALDGEEPDWQAENLTFQEGDAVDLWVEYDVNDITPMTRHWDSAYFGLDYYEYGVEHPNYGTYVVKLDCVLPYGSANEAAEYSVNISSSDAADEVPVFVFTILPVPTLDPIIYPSLVDPDNDSQGDGGGCVPGITVEFNGTSIDAVSTNDLSNVVLEFADGVHEKWDDLDIDPTTTGTYYGTGENTGKTIVRAWIKSGCNDSGDGPGYGERFEPGDKWAVGMAQMAWEDLLVSSDYDYNDFVGRLRAIEIRNMNDELVQVQLTVKAVARAAGYNANWQFNMDAAFPGATAFAVIDQYYIDGTRHGPQRLWSSSDGMSIPVFTPLRNALPNPPESYVTNGIPNTTFIDGDYAEVTIVLSTPMPQGTYTPIPYKPELKVLAAGGEVYDIGMWRQPGDWVDSNGRPLAFIVPDTYAWPLEGKHIWDVYSGFNDWIEWINDQELTEPSPAWWDIEPVQDAFDRSLFY